MGRLSKARALASSPARLERIAGLAEIRANWLWSRQRLDDAERLSWSEFTGAVAQTHGRLAEELADEMAYGEVAEILAAGQARLAAEGSLPFPLTYNADLTLSHVAHALVRTLRPELVVETGVGFGGLSTSVLHALESVGRGRLVSIDLPPLGDPSGGWTGCLIPEGLRDRWTLYRGSTRRRLPVVLREGGEVGLFLSDSANVFTLQRWEYRLAEHHLAPHGAAAFNNVGARFWGSVTRETVRSTYAVRQLKDPDGTTGLLI